MNTNIYGRNGYSALVSGFINFDQQINWGFDVREEHGDTFTIEFAKELLEFANREYKKGCPKGYNEKAYNPNLDFTYIKYDMTDYRLSGNGETYVPCGKKKVGTYDSIKNLLRIYVNGDPIYENNNGKICRDTVAILDSGI